MVNFDENDVVIITEVNHEKREEQLSLCDIAEPTKNGLRRLTAGDVGFVLDDIRIFFPRVQQSFLLDGLKKTTEMSELYEMKVIGKFDSQDFSCAEKQIVVQASVEANKILFPEAYI